MELPDSEEFTFVCCYQNLQIQVSGDVRSRFWLEDEKEASFSGTKDQVFLRLQRREVEQVRPWLGWEQVQDHSLMVSVAKFNLDGMDI